MSYFEKYDEMFSEPSKAEQIIEDAKAALWNELTEEVKQLMDDANEASTKANKLIAEISSLNFEKTELEKEIKQLREQKVYVETHEVPARQVKAIVNHLTKDFRPGDECWVIGAEYERHTCENAALREKVPQWVSVDDRHPKPGTRVLATDGVFVGEAYRTSADTWRRYDGIAMRDCIGSVVTHWMPLPEAPETPEGGEKA